MRDRKPIGDLFDQLWQQREASAGVSAEQQKENEAHKADAGVQSATTTGNIGRLSGGVLTRSEYARHGVICALVAFLQPDLYGIDPGA